ncbi:hypothetical protein H6G89_05585 [Oscillatoria sp. FACHB-1407]|uniref:hypothetical protein n=1 Tax=Oscillatoria sp. FACHB-1407 TaxID=2692847 RepID=UPI001689BB78|nr:hypothetical protein [Oscillatoria sp. FACHB-1407]MBD2460512.1 hypothetical protein [Oscillatoria sp. FACHB-1407]
MLNLDDYAVHQTTGYVGKVMGYGHQMLDGTYQPTLIVRLVKGAINQGGFLEDIASAWVQADPNTPMVKS